MIDIETHRIVDIIDSREVEDVVEWLISYPNIHIVSRDGSISYKSAINKANKNIMQVSDRFHLVKGLTDAAKKYITKIITANFGIPVSESHYNGIETATYWNGKSTVDYYTKEHNSNLEKKISLVEKVRILKEKGYSNTKIAADMDMSRTTVAKYIKLDYNPSNANYNTTYTATYSSKIKPYAEDIKRMLSNGVTFKRIEAEIREKGYKGTASTIRMYATR